MKVGEWIKEKKQVGFLLYLLFSAVPMAILVCIPDGMPMRKIFIYLLGGIVVVPALIVKTYLKNKPADPLYEYITADLVTVREVNGSGIVLEGRNPVSWDQVDEIRKVYCTIGLSAVIALPKMSPAASQSFFYVIHLREGEWLLLSKINRMTFGGSFSKGLTRSPDVVGLMKRFLSEAGKQSHIRFVCHSVEMGRFETLDFRKELEDLLRWEKK